MIGTILIDLWMVPYPIYSIHRCRSTVPFSFQIWRCEAWLDVLYVNMKWRRLDCLWLHKNSYGIYDTACLSADQRDRIAISMKDVVTVFTLLAAHDDTVGVFFLSYIDDSDAWKAPNCSQRQSEPQSLILNPCWLELRLDVWAYFPTTCNEFGSLS